MNTTYFAVAGAAKDRFAVTCKGRAATVRAFVRGGGATKRAEGGFTH